jgi:hypothetical protein
MRSCYLSNNALGINCDTCSMPEHLWQLWDKQNIECYDEILITGTPTSCYDIKKHYDKLHCMVASLDNEHIKVWPDDNDPQLSEKEKFNGKLWFCIKDCTIEILKKSDL